MDEENKEDFLPLLSVGFHDFDVLGLRRLCVDRFPQSVTRSIIMNGLDQAIALLQSNGMRGDLWIDGSFTTEKLNPDDVDIIFVMDVQDYKALLPVQTAFFSWFSTTSLKAQYRCDNYGMVRDEGHPKNEWMLAYWMRQFGFSRANAMKGIAVIKLPFLVQP
jgi:hypothetical protein